MPKVFPMIAVTAVFCFSSFWKFNDSLHSTSAKENAAIPAHQAFLEAARRAARQQQHIYDRVESRKRRRPVGQQPAQAQVWMQPYNLRTFPPLPSPLIECPKGLCVEALCPVVKLSLKAELVMCVHDGDDAISVGIRETGRWEEVYVAAIVQRAVAIGGWMVDAGSNLGAFSICGFAANVPVLSIEAAPWNAGLVDATRQYYRHHFPRARWELANVALSNKAGLTVRMHASSYNFGGSSAVAVGSHEDESWGKDNPYWANVTTSTLDQVVAQYIPTDECIAVMKIDIEGFEHFAFQGAHSFLKTRPPCDIFMEYHSILLKAANPQEEPAAVVHLLERYGYEVVSPDDFAPTHPLITDLHWRLKDPTQSAKCSC